MRKKIAVFGAGGLGKDILWQLSEMNKTYEIMGFVDDIPGSAGEQRNGFNILGTTDWLLNYKDEINVVIALSNPKLRKRKAEEISRNPAVCFPTVIANGARVSEYTRFGRGCFISSSSIVSPDVVLGDFVTVHYRCTIGHDTCLGDFVMLYPGVNVSGNVKIGSFSELGTGSGVIQGKAIGENSFIGAGGMVISDIPADCTAVGVPAKVIKRNNAPMYC